MSEPEQRRSWYSVWQPSPGVNRGQGGLECFPGVVDFSRRRKKQSTEGGFSKAWDRGTEVPSIPSPAYTRPRLGRGEQPECETPRIVRVPLLILPQVHLRKPCYDFYFLYIVNFDSLFSAPAVPPRC